MTEDILNMCLPKWPQMYTTGERVTLAQAEEIIRRTETFIVGGHGGNDHAWNRTMAKRLRLVNFTDYTDPKWVDRLRSQNMREEWARQERWAELWGAFDTQYVHNSWMSCAYIGGPHGWCHPDGRIWYQDNVGKWPSVEEVLADWAKIACEFPFLKLAATLMDAEWCEDAPRPVVTIRVEGGIAFAVEGDLRWHAEHEALAKQTIDSQIAKFATANTAWGWNAREHGPIPEEWYARWEKKAVEVEAAMKDFVYLDEDCIHDLGDIDDGWRKENERKEREEST